MLKELKANLQKYFIAFELLIDNHNWNLKVFSPKLSPYQRGDRLNGVNLDELIIWLNSTETTKIIDRKEWRKSYPFLISENEKIKILLK